MERPATSYIKYIGKLEAIDRKRVQTVKNRSIGQDCANCKFAAQLNDDKETFNHANFSFSLHKGNASYTFF